MASEPAGRTNKLGNEFERLWAVRPLIELIAGTATTVRIEASGDDEKGTEFWVGRLDGTREAHQCKLENGSTAFPPPFTSQCRKSRSAVRALQQGGRLWSRSSPAIDRRRNRAEDAMVPGLDDPRIQWHRVTFL